MAASISSAQASVHGGGRRAVTAPVAVGVGDVERAGHQRLERRPDGGQAGDRQRPHRRAVVGEVAGDDLVRWGWPMAAKYWRGQLPRRLDGLAAAGGEEHPVEVAGRQRGQAAGQLDGGRVGVGPQREVGQLAAWRAGGLGQLGPPVAGLHGEQAGQAVEVALAVAVPHVAALAPLDDGDAVGARGQPGEVAPQVVAGGLLQGVGVEGHGSCSWVIGSAWPAAGAATASRRPSSTRLTSRIAVASTLICGGRPVLVAALMYSG